MSDGAGRLDWMEREMVEKAGKLIDVISFYLDQISRLLISSHIHSLEALHFGAVLFNKNFVFPSPRAEHHSELSSYIRESRRTFPLKSSILFPYRQGLPGAILKYEVE